MWTIERILMGKYRFMTDRLAVRDMDMTDCDQVAEIWGNVEVGKYLADPYYKDGDELRSCFKNGELDNSENWTDDFYFVLLDKINEKIIGTACSWKMKGDVWAIGYAFKKEFWGQGLATELINGLEKFVKIKGGKYLSADVAKENIGSLKACYKNDFENYRQMTFAKAGTDIVYEAFELIKKIF